jgi:hypothetical protein
VTGHGDGIAAAGRVSVGARGEEPIRSLEVQRAVSPSGREDPHRLSPKCRSGARHNAHAERHRNLRHAAPERHFRVSGGYLTGNLCAVLTAPLRYLPRTAGDVKKGRMRAPSCLLDVLLHAGYVCPVALFPGVRIVAVPGRHAWGRAGTRAAVMVGAFISVRRGPRERASSGRTNEQRSAKDDA